MPPIFVLVTYLKILKVEVGLCPTVFPFNCMSITPRQVDRLFIKIYLIIIHLGISIQNISLALSCEPHPKCKPRATDNCIKRTLRKVNNPCSHSYKHRCFLPGGDNTSPSLMFLSLKLDIGGLNPQSSIMLELQ